jgi:HAD superfamily hydrolase (TIGR01509 family)
MGISKNSFHHYIFDLDGTLTDSSGPISAGLVKALKIAGISGIKADDTLQWIGRPLTEIFDAYLLHHQQRTADAVTFALMLQAYREGHDARFPDGIKIYPGAHETLTALRNSGATLAIATTKYQEAADFVCQGLGLSDYVDAVCGTNLGKPVKPDPWLIHYALEQLRAAPEKTLVIGDTDADIIAAHAAGCKAAAVRFGFGDMKELEKSKPDFWLDSLEEIL